MNRRRYHRSWLWLLLISYPQILPRDPGNSNIDPKWRGLKSFPSKFLSRRGLKMFSQPHVLKHQMGTHGSPKIKTPRSKPPKSKLQNPKSKLRDPKSKLQDPKSKLQDPNPQSQNSKIQNLHQFLVHDRSPKKMTNIFGKSSAQ